MDWKAKEDYLNVIKEYAAEGWRFIQVYTPPRTGSGMSSYIEVIFEKSKEKI